MKAIHIATARQDIVIQISKIEAEMQTKKKQLDFFAYEANRTEAMICLESCLDYLHDLKINIINLE